MQCSIHTVALKADLLFNERSKSQEKVEA